MSLVVAKIKWVMLVAGALTCTMLYAAIAPQAALQSMFGETLTGPLSEIIVRNWGALIVLSGAMLIYGAYNPPVRKLVLMVTSASKLIFVCLVLSQGNRYLSHQAGGAVVIDLIMVMFFVSYLFGVRRNPAIT